MSKAPSKSLWKEIEYYVNSNGCHICTSHFGAQGYPTINRYGKTWRISRYLFHLNNEQIAPGHIIMHKCDTPACINKEHLMIGTIADNNRDRANKGRNGDQRGMKCYNARLTDNDVTNIFTSKVSAKSIAKEYKIHVDHVYAIRNGRRWGHITRKLATA